MKRSVARKLVSDFGRFSGAFSGTHAERASTRLILGGDRYPLARAEVDAHVVAGPHAQR
jgi:hypothetical protein